MCKLATTLASTPREEASHEISRLIAIQQAEKCIVMIRVSHEDLAMEMSHRNRDQNRIIRGQFHSQMIVTRVRFNKL